MKDSIVVGTPPKADYARIVRMVASAAGAAALGFDRIEDLGLAIDEAFTRLIRQAEVVELEFEIETKDGSVAVTGRGLGGSLEDWPPADWDDSMEALVLDAVANHVELRSGSAPEIRFAI